MSIVALRSISKSFSDAEVLSQVSMSIKAGEKVALVGRSGSGKTTLLRIICGLEASTKGELLIEHGVSVGYVPQSPSLLHATTVKDNILLPLRIIKDSAVSIDAYRRVVATLGIENLEEHYPYQLSRGQAQRVALARSLILMPTLLVLDEPFASLDEFTREELDDELLRLNREFNTALLLVTHSIEEAVYIADTTYVLQERKQGLKKITTHLSDDQYGLEIKKDINFAKTVTSVRALF